MQKEINDLEMKTLLVFFEAANSNARFGDENIYISNCSSCKSNKHLEMKTRLSVFFKADISIKIFHTPQFLHSARCVFHLTV